GAVVGGQYTAGPDRDDETRCPACDHQDNRGSAHGTHQPRAVPGQTAGSKPSEVAMAAWF
ncbi:MAG TPA: hypothetical protein PLS04_15560, partial [Mycobacterium sp.]|nr:hypothetical protein [Mycobacterium sp.]